MTSISGGTINTTFTYDAKGNMTAGNGLTVSYASYDKPVCITRGTTTIGFSHDPEHQRGGHRPDEIEGTSGDGGDEAGSKGQAEITAGDTGPRARSPPKAGTATLTSATAH